VALVIEGHAAPDAWGIAWRLGATLFFVALNGFFVAAEFALVKVRETSIARRVRQGHKRASSVAHILEHLDHYLSACQLGITLASLILGALGEPAVSVLLVATAQGVGLPVEGGEGWVPIVSIGLAFAVITVLHMTVGEQAPKIWALRRAESTSIAIAPWLRLFAFVLAPFISMINRISNRLLRLAGLPADFGHEESMEADEIRSVLRLSARAGNISEKQLEITQNVIRMIDLEVRHVVVPRIEVEWLSLERPVETNLESIRGSGHSRFPLCETDLDHVVGFVHAKDVLDAQLGGGTVDLRAIARAPLVVPDTMPINDFLEEIQRHRLHCAVVLDEHGTATGLAFREDALELIVGPLGDEFDEAEPEIVQLDDGGFIVPGRCPLPEVDALADLQLGDDEREEEATLGGHLIARLGRFPRKGDRVPVGRYVATVLEVVRRRVQRVELQEVVEDEGGEASEGEERRPDAAARESGAGS
jgi:CBS domain containing-hemolysin-like protein